MIYDVSVPIDNGMPVWPTDPAVSLVTATIPSIDRRRTIRVTTIQMGSHTGTHIDAPNHFVEGGKKLHQIPLKVLVGEVAVFHIAGVPSINRRHLEQLDWLGVKRVLFKTDNSDHWRTKSSTKTLSTSNRTPRPFLWNGGCGWLVSTTSPLTAMDRNTIRRIWC